MASPYLAWALIFILVPLGMIFYYGLTDETLGNGAFQVDFHNPDTDALATGVYNWDVRYILGPYYDESGRIINGDQVITPQRPNSMELLAVVGEV